MIRIRYLSDIHLEFYKNLPLKLFLKNNGEDICILAGDIGDPCSGLYKNFIAHISKTFKKTFVIPGNHEYYNNTIKETNIYMEDFFDNFDNVSLLNNNYEIYKNYCFVGSTLWSMITNPGKKINDIYKIKDFDIQKYNELHFKSYHYLNSIIKEKENIVMITHHLPSKLLINEKYKGSEFNQWFANDLDHLIDKEKISAWFYGHTHDPSVQNIKGVDFLCNPIGYPGENSDFDLDKFYNLG